MFKTNVDTDELVTKDVRELLSEYQDGEHPNVAVKVREFGIHKDRLSSNEGRRISYNSKVY